MYIQHEKGKALELVFPMVDSASPASFKQTETVTDTAYYKDGAGAWTTLAIADTVAEIGSTGVYEISLSATEMTHDKILIKFTASNSADTMVVIDCLWPPSVERCRVESANTTPTTTLFASPDVSATTNDHYNGRIVIFTTGTLAGQATDITDYEWDGVNSEGKFTVTALAGSGPSDNDQFVIV